MRIFPVSKNARFTHDMANFGFVVRGNRCSAHEAADPALAHEQAGAIRKMPLTNVRGIFAVRMGLEPTTPGVTGPYSNQLNYRTRSCCVWCFSQTRMQS